MNPGLMGALLGFIAGLGFLIKPKLKPGSSGLSKALVCWGISGILMAISI